MSMDLIAFIEQSFLSPVSLTVSSVAAEMAKLTEMETEQQHLDVRRLKEVNIGIHQEATHVTSSISGISS